MNLTLLPEIVSGCGKYAAVVGLGKSAKRDALTSPACGGGRRARRARRVGEISLQLARCDTPTPPSPASGRGGEQSVVWLGEAVTHHSVAMDYTALIHPTKRAPHEKDVNAWDT
jgi:hypothetical protein